MSPGFKTKLKKMEPNVTTTRRPNVYTCLLSQIGTDHPTKKVIHNNYSVTPTVLRSDVGVYRISFGSYQLNDYTEICCKGTVTGITEIYRFSDSLIEINTMTHAGVFTDGLLQDNPIQIIEHYID